MTPKDQVYWYTLKQPQITPLKQAVTVDVAIVGGGMAGLMCAQTARQRGLSVAVLEAEYCGAGASGKSSGFITPDSELELSDLVASYGESQAKELWDFVVSGCEAIRRNVLDYQLNCDYQVQDSLFVANTLKGEQKVEQEHQARQKLGYDSKLYSADLVPHILGSQGYYGAVRYTGTFGIIAYLYCQGLKDILVQQGVQVYEHSPVRKLADHVLVTATHQVQAKYIVFCVDHLLPALGIIPKDVYHAQTFLGLSTPLSQSEQKQFFPGDRLMVWDTDLIYQYFRLTGEGRLLLGGASVLYTYLRREKHAPSRMVHKLRQYLKDKFPELNITLEYLWPGLIGVSKDFLPLAGKHPQLSHVYYIAGAAGVPWAAALGQYTANTIAGDKAQSFAQYFTTPRNYPVNYNFQSVFGKPITFALSHGITKYFK